MSIHLRACLVVLSVFVIAGRAAATPIQWTVGSGGNDHYYDIIRVPGGISWTAASTAATSTGGHLATITSAAEGLFVYTKRVGITTSSKQDVVVSIYDASGRRVREFASATVEGEYSVAWDGTDARGVRVPSGIYFARASSRAGVVVARLVLIR